MSELGGRALEILVVEIEDRVAARIAAHARGQEILSLDACLEDLVVNEKLRDAIVGLIASDLTVNRRELVLLLAEATPIEGTKGDGSHE